ncbi:carbon-nitrogen hydrolase family protein [Dictyobacter formicarum]|uniref:Nitrilase n=1 Tax=Dictyobacter formicarum TaxID=2778368 RepID=A0ABQ3VPQ8_9CHLR|nr:carbon-nitrogen hydrolase family protein [Dictyobacter formicarum]GHO87679.1 nitrilase [Dictyobacter formicarum]
MKSMSHVHNTPFTVAVAQVAPVYLDCAATVEKACECIVDAGQAGARLIIFPESFICGYPVWVWNIPPGEQSLLSELYVTFRANAVRIPGEVTDRLCRMAQRARINVVMGLTECATEVGGVCCYNAQLYINAQGQIVGKHRSLVLNGAERLVWTAGNGSTLQVYKMPMGIIGGLIGGENYLPLARHSLYAWGTQFYVATSWEHGEIWHATLRHIAREGQVFILGCNAVLPAVTLSGSAPLTQFSLCDKGGWLHPGGSVIINPEGEIIAGPLLEQEAILYAEIDVRKMHRSKWMLDVTGQDARPDIFQLTVHCDTHPLIQIKDRQSAAEEKLKKQSEYMSDI